MKKKTLDKKQLYDLYVVKKQTIKSISKQLKCCENTIFNYLKQYKISREDNFINKRFGRLVVIKKEPNKKNTHSLYLCKCDCGKKVVVRKYLLATNNSKSCGCSRIGKNNSRFTGYEEIRGKQWYSLKQGAKLRNLEFSIDIEYAWNLYLKQDKKCALTGLSIPFGRRTVDKDIASLDRIDSNKGYVKGNVQWVHKDINRLKQHFKEDYLFYLCKLIVKRIKDE